LRSVAEQTPFDAATFSYAFPLLAEVLVQGGVGSGDEDEVLEQVALVLDIIKFHCGECMWLSFGERSQSNIHIQSQSLPFPA